MNAGENKIEAKHQTLFEVLNERKYTVDYFQREYSWGEKHIEELVTDLTTAFRDEHKPSDKREQVEDYNNYYLGPIVVSKKNGKESIIDGQQRLTSLTLFLIYLHHLQKGLSFDGKIESMIFSERWGTKSFNLIVEERTACLDALFNHGEYIPDETDDESAVRMSERYQDISGAFPDEIKNGSFPFFIDWLKHKVIMVQIIAYSDENAYTIFETMNDRGLNLTSTEMLKSFILSQYDNADARQNANDKWKAAMMKLKSYDKEEDQSFFQAWLRSKYADTIRQAQAGSKNEDFEKIGTRFHSWVKDNKRKVLNPKGSSSFEQLIDREFSFYLKHYYGILDARQTQYSQLEHVFYISRWGIASTLSLPLMLAPLNVEDSDSVAFEKINTVARYIESFAVRRSVNFKLFSSNSIRYTMYNLVKEIRSKELSDLKDILSIKLKDMEQTFDAISEFYLHGQNKRFVRFLLSRITAWVEQKAGKSSNFATYYESTNKAKPYQIEHIWADKLDRHKDEFDQEQDFQDYRNRIGNLVLLPEGTNQSLGALAYEEKLPHYLKQNLLVQSLCPGAYERNPNFTKAMRDLGLPFRAYKEFKKADIDERQHLYKKISELIWPDDLS